MLEKLKVDKYFLKFKKLFPEISEGSGNQFLTSVLCDQNCIKSKKTKTTTTLYVLCEE